MEETPMPRTPPRRLLAAVVLTAAWSLCAGPPAAAGDVALFQERVPSVAELSHLLWPQPVPPAPEVRRTRGLKWGQDNLDLAPTQVAVETPAETAAEAPRGFAFLVRFAFDSTAILPESRPFLDRLGELLLSEQAQGRRVEIVGHADATGPERYNQRLSEARAEAVRGYLVAWYGVPSERLAVTGRGEREPRDGIDPADPTNRRVEFLPAD
jgi:outer membrane protein OmpA-like peptidoglycan-associated protein